MRMSQIFGAALFAVGVVLLIFAYQASNAPVDQVLSTVTGHYSNQTMWYMVLGIVGVIGGGLMFATGRRV
jgi:drug/metabolite transporter (DMT)-like permease